MKKELNIDSSTPAFIKDKAVSQFGRDVGIGTTQIMWEIAGNTRISGIIAKLGPVMTAIDVYNEVTTNTREERLIELTVYVAQFELLGVREPSTDHSYIKIPESEFNSPEEATFRMNQIYNKLDEMFKAYDLTDDEDYNMVRDIIGKMPGLSFKDYFLSLPNNGFNGLNPINNGVKESGDDNSGKTKPMF